MFMVWYKKANVSNDNKYGQNSANTLSIKQNILPINTGTSERMNS